MKGIIRKWPYVVSCRSIMERLSHFNYELTNVMVSGVKLQTSANALATIEILYNKSHLCVNWHNA